MQDGSPFDLSAWAVESINALGGVDEGHGMTEPAAGVTCLCGGACTTCSGSTPSLSRTRSCSCWTPPITG
ncbi:hypothetical protein AB0K60_28200 [Thermopolyspora sp. NPDC052614]|uniref:hypothetical protein n=1 Tax=Thermopolyspora sp. NPDC052614 TaxID=3155682 RepID=UPI00344526ED